MGAEAAGGHKRGDNALRSAVSLARQDGASAGYNITPQRQPRSPLDLITHYFEVNFDSFAEELVATSSIEAGPALGLQQRELAAAHLRETIRTLLAHRQTAGADVGEEAVLGLIAGQPGLSDAERSLLRHRAVAVLYRQELSPAFQPRIERRKRDRRREPRGYNEPEPTASQDSPPGLLGGTPAPENHQASTTVFRPVVRRPPPHPAPGPTSRSMRGDPAAAVASVMQALVSNGLELLPCDLCQAYLLEDDIYVLHAEAPAEEGAALSGPKTLSPVVGISHRARRELIPITVNDVSLLEGAEEIWADRGVQVIAAVALNGSEAEPSGLLVASRVTPRPFAQPELAELQRLASEVVLAMASADLLSRAEELAVLKERMKLAREIHDGLASDLSAVVALFKYYDQRRIADPADAERLMVQMRELVEGALHTARDILATLRPRPQTPRKLVDAVKRHVADFASTYGVTAITRVEGDDRRLVAEERDTIFQILREALTNVRKHSDAATIEVRLDLGERPYTLVVEDDGVGIDPQAAEAKAGSFGITGMRERAELLGGWLEVGNGPLGGARVVFTGPEVALGG